MILETYEDKATGFKSHVCTIRMNGELYFTVDIFDTVEKTFLPIVKTFKPNEKQRAIAFAKETISA